MEPNVDVVIVAFRSEQVIEEAIRRVKYVGLRVVVVDHGDGRSAKVAEALGAVTLLDPSNPGFGSGQNRGIVATSSPFVLLCNPDAVVEPAAVRHGAEFLAVHPDVAAVQGAIVNSCTRRPERSQGVELGPLHLLGRAVGARHLLSSPVVRRLASRNSLLRDHVERVPREPVEVETLAATAILVRRSAFDEVGGFDPTYFLYGEDMDLCRRLRTQGWRLVAMPEIWATHVNGGSSESGFAQELQWWRGTMAFAARWWGSTAWTAAVAAAGIRVLRLAMHSREPLKDLFESLVSNPMRRRAGRGEAVAPPVSEPRPCELSGSIPDHRISVVIRCHQQGRFLTEAVASVRAQSRAADEIVVVDDGSSDETADVLATLEEGGPLQILRHHVPLGPAQSLNAGVHSSSGDLVLVLDADDALSPEYLELTEKGILSGADMAYGGVERFGSESPYSPARAFDAYELGVENFLHIATLFRRSLFDAVGGFRRDLDQLGLEDWAFWLSAVEGGAAAQAVEGCWLRYRRHPEGSRNTMHRMAVLKVHLRMHQLHPAAVSWGHLARWVARSVWRNLCTAISLDIFKKTRVADRPATGSGIWPSVSRSRPLALSLTKRDHRGPVE